MDIRKLIDTQRQLDEHIMNEHPELKGQDNLEWKLLALQVELGECANEWRGFKKWSNDQKPRTRVIEYGEEIVDGKLLPLETESNPLLEEYVDCLHFILTIAIELGHENLELWDRWPLEFNITTGFIDLSGKARDISAHHILYNKVDIALIEGLLAHFVSLGQKLGFTEDQIEEAYYAKNQINHKRQESGY